MREIDDTQASYRQIAAAYTAANASRDVITAHLHRFFGTLPARGPVLDAGCGPGYDMVLMAAAGLQPVGMDLSRQMMLAGRGLGHREPFVQADMRRLPLRGETAVGVWACASLVHTPRRLLPELLQEFCRVLQPGGMLYLSVKQGDGEGWAAASYGLPARRYFVYWRGDALDPLLAAAGFLPVAGWQEPAGETIWLVRLVRKRTSHA